MSFESITRQSTEDFSATSRQSTESFKTSRDRAGLVWKDANIQWKNANFTWISLKGQNWSSISRT